MDNKDYIKFLLNKNVEFHNRINNTIEEILRRNNGEQATNDLIESLEYIVEDMKRVTKILKNE